MNSFSRNVLKLLSGGVAAQVIYILTLPVVTRYYDVGDVGMYGSILSTITVFSVLISMRTELFIVEERGERGVAISASIFYIVLSFLFFSPAYFFYLSSFLNFSNLVFLLSVLAALTFALFQVGNSVLLREDKYLKSSAANVLRVSVCVVLQIVLVLLFESDLYFLLLGYLLSFVSAILFVKIQPSFYQSDILIKYIKNNFSAIKYGGGHALLNSVSQSAPYLIFSYFFPAPLVGLFFIADKAFRAPLLLVGTPIKQVFLRYVSVESNIKKVLHLYSRIILSVFVSSVLIISLLFTYGQGLFAFFFGEEYLLSGQIAAWLSIWGAGALSSFPALSFLRIKNKHSFLFYNELIFLVIKVVSVCFVAFYFQDFLLSITIYSLINLLMSVNFICYALYLMRNG